MKNLTEEQKIEVAKIVESILQKKGRQILHQGDVPPGTIKKRHIEDVVIVFGDEADRPDSAATGVKAYFATDTGVFACWDGQDWLETTLT